jgi:hypothetical protein
MSGGVVFTRDAAIRTRDAVRRVEAGIPPNTSRGIPDTNRVYAEIVTEVGSGEYTAKAVKRDNDVWAVRVNDIFTDDSIPIFEANGVTGLEVGTVVEVYRLWDETTETKYFVFFATGGGGGGAVPVQIKSKLEDGVWDIHVFGNGSQVAATDTSNSIIRIPQIAAGETLPLNTWVFATLIGTDATYPTKTHYEGQVPVWL